MPTIYTVTDANQSSYQKDGTTPISLSGFGDQVLLASGATIRSAADANGNSGHGISSGLAAGDVWLLLMGSVESASSAGIRMVSSGNKILIGSTGEVFGGTSGILLSDAFLGSGGNWVDNWGLVKGTGATGIGIGANFSDNSLSNRGTVEGFKGIVAGSAGSSNNKVFNSGSILSTDVGVTLYGNGSSLTNSGLIRSSAANALVMQSQAGETITVLNTGTIESTGSNAILGSEGSDRIINHGTISGTVFLGGGDDFFDSREGTITNAYALFLGEGNDTAYGGTGNDEFYDDSGNDFMDGGAGNDVFYSFSPGEDTVIGGANDDQVLLSGVASIKVNFSGGDGIDSLKLSKPGFVPFGTTLNAIVDLRSTDLRKIGDIWGSIQLSGVEAITTSEGNDLLIGNDSNNFLHASAGSDTLEGGLGNDELNGWTGFDFARFTGSTGAKVILGSTAAQVTGFGADKLLDIEGLIGGSGADSFTGDNNANSLHGNAGNDILLGGIGTDTLLGGAGNDKLTGGTQADFFVFNAKLSKTSNVDTITDFKRVDDTFQLENAIFKKLTKVNALSKSFFVVGAKAKDKNDYIVYDKAKGYLYYDADGSGKGAAVLFAKIKKGTVIDHKDFFVI
jgi:Ca2+-binding RTX toxin-like protein